jgi:hypothetical protein
MDPKQKKEIRIPIPGTPAVLIEHPDQSENCHQTEPLQRKWQHQLDIGLADTFPASDPPSTTQPDPTRSESDPACQSEMGEADNKDPEAA